MLNPSQADLAAAERAEALVELAKTGTEEDLVSYREELLVSLLDRELRNLEEDPDRELSLFAHLGACLQRLSRIETQRLSGVRFPAPDEQTTPAGLSFLYQAIEMLPDRADFRRWVANEAGILERETSDRETYLELGLRTRPPLPVSALGLAEYCWEFLVFEEGTEAARDLLARYRKDYEDAH